MDEQQYETRIQIDEPIIKKYLYGSRVYGCNTEYSDFDYIAVVKSDEDLYYSVITEEENITVYSESMFIKRIQEHHISALECIFQDKDDEYLKYFSLDLEKLRKSISAVSSNSFVKCKKKLAQGEYYIGRKSLFHSLRILGFGIQIAIYGEIVDYSAYNHYLYEIMDMNSDDFTVYKERFQPIYNMKKSRFKMLAPLDKDNRSE